MEINKIIKEEIQTIQERHQDIFTIPELVQKLSVFGLNQESLAIYQELLLIALKEGDDKVVEVFKELSGVQIEAVSKGRYMFNSIVDPNKI